MAKHQVVIVGGGFGGVKCALTLAEKPLFDVTLIHDQSYLSYFPTMFRTATGGSKKISAIPLTEIFNRVPIHLVQDSLTGLDRKNQVITTATNKTFHYDALILALGVKTNYFGIEGLDKFSYGIKTVEDAEKFKSHLHQQLIEDNKPDLNYVIIGGGPTGVELAGALPTYLNKLIKQHSITDKQFHIDLVEAAPRLLPRSPKDLSRSVARHLKHCGIKLYLKTTVKAETGSELVINDKSIYSHTVIWTAGVTNNPFFATNNFQLNHGKVRVDQYLQAESGIYVIGDNADTPYSGLAQTAIYDGAYVAKNLIRLANNQELKPYIAKKPIYVFPAGPNWAAVLWGPIKIYGKLGAILRKFADLEGFHDYEPLKLAIERMLSEEDNEESCPICASDEA